MCSKLFKSYVFAGTYRIKSQVVPQYIITVIQIPNITITPADPVFVNQGEDSPEFVITPDQSYQITNVLIDGVSAGILSSYTFQNVTENHEITASYDLVLAVVHDKKINWGAQRFFTRGNTLGNQINFFYSAKKEDVGLITICDLLGKRVHEICFTLPGVIGNQNPSLVAQWDFKNKNGRRVATGTYIAALIVIGDNGRKERYNTKIDVKVY